MSTTPLAERLRPKTLDDFVGQSHLISKNANFRKIIESGNIHSMIFWGPPGVGKTTLARIISNITNRQFFSLNAVSSGVKDVREVIKKAESGNLFINKPPILFIDEIHRFSKSQQDSLLSSVEKGTVVLIGATTENPSFEVISPLLSRSQVYILKSLGKDDLDSLLQKALNEDVEFKKADIKIIEKDALFRFSGGDARKLYNILELIYKSSEDKTISIDNKKVISVLQENILTYDKQGEMHYDVISAFIKSVRGSDPDASVYWLARMIDGGEDIKFIARRLLILAAEDIGLANPNALLIANACFDAVSKIGMPESRIILSQCTIYLASSPKSNSAYMAIDSALGEIKNDGLLSVPLHLRNAPTKLMKDLNYGKDYKYSHNYSENFKKQDYLPDEIKNKKFYYPGKNKREDEIQNRLDSLWKKEE